MSRFMLTIASPGLMREPAGVEGDALADQHDGGRASRAPAASWGGRVVEPDQPRRAWPRPGRRRGCPPKPSSASRCSSQTVTSSPASSARATAWSASHGGVLRLDGTEAERAGSPARPADRHRPLQRRPVVVGHPGEHDPARRGRARAAPCARRRRTSPGVAPTTNGSRPTAGSTAGDRGGHGVAVEHRPGQRGAGPAEVVGAGGAEPDEQHLAQLGVVRSAQRDRQGGHLADLAGGALGVEHGEQVDPEQLADLVGAGPEHRRAAVLARRAPGARSRPRRAGRAGASP